MTLGITAAGMEVGTTLGITEVSAGMTLGTMEVFTSVGGALIHADGTGGAIHTGTDSTTDTTRVITRIRKHLQSNCYRGESCSQKFDRHKSPVCDNSIKNSGKNFTVKGFSHNRHYRIRKSVINRKQAVSDNKKQLQTSFGIYRYRKHFFIRTWQFNHFKEQFRSHRQQL